jgi:sugar phosphate isomerase/epimerase
VYLEKGFARAEKLYVKVQGFGCAAARNCPDGWPKGKALSQLDQFLGMAAALAAKHGIYVAVEGLNSGECNLINTVSEAAVLARLTHAFNVGVMADWYHMALDKEDRTGIVEEKKMLLHCHIANPAGRRFPLPGDGADYALFSEGLKKIKYAGRVSVEGKGEPQEYAACLQRLRELFQ